MHWLSGCRRGCCIRSLNRSGMCLYFPPISLDAFSDTHTSAHNISFVILTMPLKWPRVGRRAVKRVPHWFIWWSRVFSILLKLVYEKFYGMASTWNCSPPQPGLNMPKWFRIFMMYRRHSSRVFSCVLAIDRRSMAVFLSMLHLSFKAWISKSWLQFILSSVSLASSVCHQKNPEQDPQSTYVALPPDPYLPGRIYKTFVLWMKD